MIDERALLSEVSRQLARFPTLLDLLVGELDETAWRSRPAPDEWAPVEIICHLRDEETEDFAARVGVILNGGTRFARIDPERAAIERRYREADAREALAAFHARRAASIGLLATIVPARLLASADRPDSGRLSGLDLLAAWVTHDRLHLHQLAGTLARSWASRWAPLHADYAGPIPYASP
jgi:hypothetical protein